MNTFQCILASSPYESFVIFVYDDIQWASTGDEALAGVNAGDGVNHVTIPGSQTSSILNIEETSNVGNPGVWMFSVSKGTYHVFVYIAVYVCMYSFNTYPFTYTHMKQIDMYIHTYIY